MSYTIYFLKIIVCQINSRQILTFRMYILTNRTHWYDSFADLTFINDFSVYIDSFLQKPLFRIIKA